jgi:hypothetical protein
MTGVAVLSWLYVEPNAFFGVRSAPIVPKFVPKFLVLQFPSGESEMRSEEQPMDYWDFRHVRNLRPA